MDNLVSTEWLAGQLGTPDLVVLDASMHLPDSGRDARAEFGQQHIPGARFLDLDSFVDSTSPVPKALPSAEQFAVRMGALGVPPGSRVVLYDDSMIRSSARGWFVCELYGIAQVAILDGGLAKWLAEGRPTESGMAEFPASDFPVPGTAREVRSKADMLANCAACDEQVVDARDAGRFAGAEGSGSDGHIPGACNLPFGRLFAEDGTWKDPEAIRAEFTAAGIALDSPVITSCNSGMTASVLLFGLARAGKGDAALYDGSWLEWGADPATPKQSGPAD
ncbi:sulfurtransferase [Qipengyuania marisflavi]|uniref:Sulfurtransferase n=1 Tax=Qipengyuania marisflavi TaxID=2486356 RepID=A0A5S3P6H7_9SPHN|nr:sulfurtransferase [Qipengyuania marisflavi]TMM48828.1 sulfurtransferase [Qipengyuania marisflavi]